MENAPSGAFFLVKTLLIDGKPAPHFGLLGLKSQRARQCQKSTRM